MAFQALQSLGESSHGKWSIGFGTIAITADSQCELGNDFEAFTSDALGDPARRHAIIVTLPDYKAIREAVTAWILG